MILDEVLARLQAAAIGIPFEASVPLRDEVAKAAVAGTRAFVFLGDEVAQPSERATGPVLQLVDHEIVVVLMIASAAGAGATLGAAAARQGETLKAAVQAALISWTPASAVLPIEYAGAVVLGAIATGRFGLQLTFSTQSIIGG